MLNIRSVSLLAVAFVTLLSPSSSLNATVQQPVLTKTAALDSFHDLQLTFIPNAGQLPTPVQYYARGAAHSFYFTSRAVSLVFVQPQEAVASSSHGVALELQFVGGREARVEPRGRARGTVSYLVGSDRTRWLRNLPTSNEVEYRGVWPGIDARFRGAGGELKYEFVVGPGASPGDIQLAYAGADGLSVDDKGNLLIKTAIGTLRDARPASYQIIDGKRVDVPSKYDVQGMSYRFMVGAYNSAYAVVIDPGISYSTYLGGTANEEAFGIAIGGRDVFVTGSTRSADFPTTAGAFDDTTNGSDDVFVTKFDRDGGELIYSTYIGGSGSDVAEDVAVDGAHAFVTGETESADFPVTAAFDSSHNGGEDAFVLKLDSHGSDLVYSTFVGGQGNEQGRGIATSGGKAYVVGVTDSADFPVSAGSIDVTLNGSKDVFVTHLTATGDALVYSTYLGGQNSDVGRGIDVRGSTAFITGFTDSADFPTTPGAFDTTYNQNRDAFVARIDVHGAALEYSTFLGGSSSDEGFGIAADGQGNAYLTGQTFSADFPTTAGAFDQSHNGNDDAYVTKLSADGASLEYSTFLGGEFSEHGRGIDIDGSGQNARGNAYIVGTTNSRKFPTTPDGDQTYNGGISDVFVTELTSDGSALVFSTYLGGSRRDVGRALVVRGGDAYVTGFTNSLNFPTTAGAYDDTQNGERDVFVTKFRLTEQRRR